MTINDEDAAELARLQERYDDADAATVDARADFYAKLLQLDVGATHQEIGDVLGVSRQRAQQLVAQARRWKSKNL